MPTDVANQIVNHIFGDEKAKVVDAVNDALSVSAGAQNVEFDGAAKDEKNSGIGASYTMGSISMYGGFNKLENTGGSATAADVEASIFNISFAF